MAVLGQDPNTDYPTSLDTQIDRSSGDIITSASINGTNKAIEAIQNELGTTPSGSQASVRVRLDTFLPSAALSPDALVFTDSSNLLTTNVSGFSVDLVNIRLGVGVSSPAQTLDLQNATRCQIFMESGARQFKINVEDGVETTIGTVTNNSIQFIVGNTERARLNNAGRFIVGGTSGALTVNAEGTAAVGYRAERTGTPNIISKMVADESNSKTVIGSETDHKLSFIVNDTERMVVDVTTGNLGIGTDAPARELHINKNLPQIRLSDADATTDDNTRGSIEFYRGSATQLQVEMGLLNGTTTNFAINSVVSGNVDIEINGSRAFRATGANGAVRIGSATIPGGATFGDLLATRVFEAGTQICYPLEKYFSGNLSPKWAENEGAQLWMINGKSRFYDFDTFWSELKRDVYLPLMPSRQKIEKGEVSNQEYREKILEILDIYAIYFRQLFVMCRAKNK